MEIPVKYSSGFVAGAPKAAIFRRIGAPLTVLCLLCTFGVTRVDAQPFAYVTNATSNNVSVINTATNTVVATVPVGALPLGVAITPDGTRAYVANGHSGNVSVINTATNTVVATVPAGTEPYGVAITPDGTHAYLTNATSNNVSVINTATNTVVATVPVAVSPIGVAITPNGARAYVANAGSNTVSVINTASNTVVAIVPVGNSPVAVAITPNGARAYVTNQASGTVSVIDTLTNTVAATVPVGAVPNGVAVTPNGTRAYVANVNSNNVSVINTATNTVVATVPVGVSPGNGFGVAVTPNGTRAYVANFGSNNVSVINTATNTVVATVPVGNSPVAVAIGNSGCVNIKTASAVNIDAFGATIQWTTDHASDSQVLYGLSTAYGSIANGPPNVTNHSVDLIGLTPSTEYHYQAVSRSAVCPDGATSPDQTFVTNVGIPQLKVTDIGSGNLGGKYQVFFYIKNVGTGMAAAYNAQITTVTLGTLSRPDESLPDNMGTIFSNMTRTESFNFARSAGSPGSVVLVRVAGTYTTTPTTGLQYFGHSFRLTLPTFP